MDEMFKVKHEFREHPEYLRFLAHKEEISLLLKPLMSSSSSRLPIENVSKLVAEAILQKEKQVQEEIERRLKEQEESLTQALVSQMSEEHTKRVAELTAEKSQEIERIKLQLETATASMGIMEEENKQMQQRIDELQVELKGYWLSPEEFNQIYKETMDKTVSIGSEFELNLDLAEIKYRKLLKALSKSRLPKLNKISIKDVKEGGEDVKKFIQNSVPDSIQIFFFNNNTPGSSLLHLDPYMDSLLQVAPKANVEFKIFRSSVSLAQFKSLVVAAKDWKEIGFYYCALLIDSEVDFSDNLDNSLFSILDLYLSGQSDRSDFATHPSRLKNILKGLGKVPKVRANLKKIRLQKAGLKKADVESMLAECGFANVEITGL